jgi:hypothetical protein
MYDASSVNYYRGREQAQRQLADQAASIAIRNIHLDLADRYREMAQEAQLKRTGQDRDCLPSDNTSASDGEQARA